MVIDDVTKILTEDELMQRAEWLVGKTLIEIVSEINESDEHSRVTTKSDVGYAVEKGFFGINKNSTAGADIPHLGIEVKTCPLKYNKARTRLSVKEPLSLNMINYNEEVNRPNLKDSSLYKKNHKILFVFYIHDTDVPRSQYEIKYVFLWEMTDKVLAELQPDYDKIIDKIKAGIAHEIHQGDHERLTLCPKHNGKFSDPNDKISKTTQPFSSAPAERRAYRFKASYVNKIIAEHYGY